MTLCLLLLFDNLITTKFIGQQHCFYHVRNKMSVPAHHQLPIDCTILCSLIILSGFWRTPGITLIKTKLRMLDSSSHVFFLSPFVSVGFKKSINIQMEKGHWWKKCTMWRKIWYSEKVVFFPLKISTFVTEISFTFYNRIISRTFI